MLIRELNLYKNFQRKNTHQLYFFLRITPSKFHIHCQGENKKQRKIDLTSERNKI